MSMKIIPKANRDPSFWEVTFEGGAVLQQGSFGFHTSVPYMTVKLTE